MLTTIMLSAAYQSAKYLALEVVTCLLFRSVAGSIVNYDIARIILDELKPLKCYRNAIIVTTLTLL